MKTRPSLSAASRRKLNRQLRSLVYAESKALLERRALIREREGLYHSAFLFIVYAFALLACAISFWIVLASPLIQSLTVTGIAFK